MSKTENTTNTSFEANQAKSESDQMCPPLSDQVWSQLLGPLDLITAIRVQHTCAVFSRTVFAGQRRLVWDKSFRDYLLRTTPSIDPRVQQQWFLFQIARKIGANGRQLVVKSHTMPANHAAILRQMPRLQALNYKLMFYSIEFDQLFGSVPIKRKAPEEPTVPHSLPLTELTVEFGTRDPQVFHNYLPPTFPAFIDHWGSQLTTLEVWRSETQLGNTFDRLTALTCFSMFVHTAESLALFCKFGQMPSMAKLVELSVEWQCASMDTAKLILFVNALSELTALQRLDLTFNWRWDVMNLQSASPHVLIQNLRDQYLVNVRRLTTLTRMQQLAFNIEHNPFCFPLPTATLVGEFVRRFDRLQLLQLTISDMSSLPLTIPTTVVHTLELSFRYLKTNFLVWRLVPNRELYPPRLINQFDAGAQLRALKLVHCPPFVANCALFEIGAHFTGLQLLSVSGSVSLKLDELGQLFSNLVTNALPSLRVFTLRYRPHSWDFGALARVGMSVDPAAQLAQYHELYEQLSAEFRRRALRRLDEQFALDVTDGHLYFTEATLNASANVRNLRIYLEKFPFNFCQM